MRALVIVHAGTPAEAAVTEELVTLASEMASDAVDVLAVGASAQQAVAPAWEHGASWVGVGAEVVARWQTDPAVDAAAQLMDARSPQIVLAAERRFERDLLSRLAARKGCTSLCGCVGFDDGSLTLRAGDGVLGVALTEVAPVTVGVVPWTVAPIRLGSARHESEAVPVSRDSDTVLVEHATREDEQPSIGHARVVVAGGRGLQRGERFELLETLAARLPGAAVGASAAAVNHGWAPTERLIGKTGTQIAPLLYIAAGISGSFFHEASTRSAEYILAINRDRDAPLAARAQLLVVGDAAEHLSALAQELSSEGNRTAIGWQVPSSIHGSGQPRDARGR